MDKELKFLERLLKLYPGERFMRVFIGEKPGWVRVDENNRAIDYKKDGSFNVLYEGDNGEVLSFYTTHKEGPQQKGPRKMRRSGASYHTNYDLNTRLRVREDKTTLLENNIYDTRAEIPNYLLRLHDLAKSAGSSYHTWNDWEGNPHTEFWEQPLSPVDPLAKFYLEGVSIGKALEGLGGLASRLSSLRRSRLGEAEGGLPSVIERPAEAPPFGELNPEFFYTPTGLPSNARTVKQLPPVRQPVAALPAVRQPVAALPGVTRRAYSSPETYVAPDGAKAAIVWLLEDNNYSPFLIDMLLDSIDETGVDSGRILDLLQLNIEEINGLHERMPLRLGVAPDGELVVNNSVDNTLITSYPLLPNMSPSVALSNVQRALNPEITPDVVPPQGNVPLSVVADRGTYVAPRTTYTLSPSQGLTPLPVGTPYFPEYDNHAIDSENIALDMSDGSVAIFPRTTSEMEPSPWQPVFDDKGLWLGNYVQETGEYYPLKVRRTRGPGEEPYKKLDFVDESGNLRPDVDLSGLSRVYTGTHYASSRGLKIFNDMDDRERFLRLAETRDPVASRREMTEIMKDNGWKYNPSTGRTEFVPQSGKVVHTHSGDTSLDSTVTGLKFLEMLFPGHEFVPLPLPASEEFVHLNGFGLNNRFDQIEYLDDDFKDFITSLGNDISDIAFDNKYSVAGDDDFIYVNDKSGKLVGRVKRKSLLESVDNLNRSIDRFNRKFGTNYKHASITPYGSVKSPNIYGIGIRKRGGRLIKRRK